MTLKKEDRQALIKYRIECANNSTEDALYLIKGDKLIAAVNRIYYAIFYVLTALSIKHQFKTSKHQRLIGWFNKTFIKEKVIDEKYSQIVRDAFKKRTVGDYGEFIEFEKEEVLTLFEDMKEFVDVIERLILSDE